MKIKGKLIKKEGVRIVTDKFKNLRFVIEVPGDYPQTIQLELHQDNVTKIDNFSIGDELTCDIDLRGRSWTNKEGEVMYFNTIVCWKIEGAVEVTGQPTAEATDVDKDDLPF